MLNDRRERSKITGWYISMQGIKSDGSSCKYDTNEFFIYGLPYMPVLIREHDGMVVDMRPDDALIPPNWKEESIPFKEYIKSLTSDFYDKYEYIVKTMNTLGNVLTIDDFYIFNADEIKIRHMERNNSGMYLICTKQFPFYCEDTGYLAKDNRIMSIMRDYDIEIIKINKDKLIPKLIPLSNVIAAYNNIMEGIMEHLSYGVLVGGYYKHFKGNIIKVLTVARDTEDDSMYRVIYTHEGHTWVRPLDMFLSEVDHKKYPDVKQKMRFELITE